MTKIFALLLLATAYGCAVEPARAVSAPPRRAVHVAKAERTSRSVVTEVVGTVRAVRSSNVAALVSGTVAEVRVGLGSTVRAGEVLVRLSAREIDARLEQARAMATLATPERDRAASLKALGAISTAQYEQAVSQWNVAQAREAEAHAIAQRTLVRAPFAGVVSEKRVNVGDAAMPGQALLVVEAPGAFRFEARVPETIALGVGQAIPVRIDGVAHDLAGTIAEIQPASDEATRTRLVKVALPTTFEHRSGRFGRLLLGGGSSVAVSIPAQALVRRGQLEGVFVVAAGSARLRLVRAARERAGRLEIASGLVGGEDVVLAQGADLVDGEPVEVVP